MTTRTDQFKALPRGAQVGVVVVLVALAVWLFVGMSGTDDSPEASACESFAALVDDVQGGRVDANSMEVIDRMEDIGEQLRQADGDYANAGLMATSAAQASRSFPAEERDGTMAAAVKRVDGVCS